MHDMNPADDLTRRTWRQWWRELPGYYRIGVWTVLAVVGLHVAVAVRIYFGLQEAAAINVLRGQGHSIYFFWELQKERYRGEHLIKSGLFGRSPRNVDTIIFQCCCDGQDLLRIGQSFPNLESVSFINAEIKTDDLAHLRNCSRIRKIAIMHANVDDAIDKYLEFFPKLSHISLIGTLVGDDTLHALLKMPEIEYIDVSYTDVSGKAVELALDNNLSKRLKIKTESRYQNNPRTEVVSVIRWSDGARTAVFNGPYELRYTLQEIDPEVDQLISGSLQTEYFTRSSGWWSEGNMNVWNGDYQTTLTLGKQTSEPVIITFEAGIPLPRHVEFRMPVTREEALRSIAK